jgi:hypothetical protein
MLRELSPIVSLILALLLIVLTPVGTGQGTHRNQLLDPLFPHVHFADRTTLALRNPQRAPEPQGAGPALGAEAGAAAASLSVGLTPTVPTGWQLPRLPHWFWRPVLLTTEPHGALGEPPPDPPPTIA